MFSASKVNNKFSSKVQLSISNIMPTTLYIIIIFQCKLLCPKIFFFGNQSIDWLLSFQCICFWRTFYYILRSIRILTRKMATNSVQICISFGINPDWHILLKIHKQAVPGKRIRHFIAQYCYLGIKC